MNGLNPSPINIKIIPPIFSHFQATSNNAMRMNVGIKCIMKFCNCCPTVSPGSNESSANILMNRIAMMQITRGSQWNTLIDVLIWLKIMTLHGKYYDVGQFCFETARLNERLFRQQQQLAIESRIAVMKKVPPGPN